MLRRETLAYEALDQINVTRMAARQRARWPAETDESHLKRLRSGAAGQALRAGITNICNAAI
jgi:hypothetical protein